MLLLRTLAFLFAALGLADHAVADQDCISSGTTSGRHWTATEVDFSVYLIDETEMGQAPRSSQYQLVFPVTSAAHGCVVQLSQDGKYRPVIEQLSVRIDDGESRNLPVSNKVQFAYQYYLSNELCANLLAGLQKGRTAEIDLKLIDGTLLNRRIDLAGFPAAVADAQAEHSRQKKRLNAGTCSAVDDEDW